MKYFVLAYYWIGELKDLKEELGLHKNFLNSLDFRGRIYLSEQGINGQASAPEGDAETYMAWMRSRFAGIEFKLTPVEEHAFAKMTVKVRGQLVAIDCEVDFSLRGEHVSPSQWKTMLQERDEETLLLDVRNDYEWEVGHFEGAELPKLETFRQFPAYAKQLKELKDPTKTRVMMYCTGGIRCEFYSAVLKKEGFEKVYQLEGGVIGYGMQEGGEGWKGNLFVFDDRLVVPVGDKRAEAIASCKHCSSPCDVYYNCANMDCNALFVCCTACLKTLAGACCAACQTAPRLRVRQDDSAKPFRKLNSCYSNVSSSSSSS